MIRIEPCFVSLSRERGMEQAMQPIFCTRLLSVSCRVLDILLTLLVLFLLHPFSWIVVDSHRARRPHGPGWRVQVRGPRIVFFVLSLWAGFSSVNCECNTCHAIHLYINLPCNSAYPQSANRFVSKRPTFPLYYVSILVSILVSFYIPTDPCWDFLEE